MAGGFAVLRGLHGSAAVGELRDQETIAKGAPPPASVCLLTLMQSAPHSAFGSE